MTLVHRILYPHPIEDLAEYVKRRGGRGIEEMAHHDADEVLAVLDASGLRGRGGAGFPTGRKWRTVRDNRAPHTASSVVVNGAEGEPGAFKDRSILRNNPYQVIEGAVIGARVVGADEIVFAIKTTFGPERARLKAALSEVSAAGWTDGIDVRIFEGPNEYLFGEETALLETIEGRYPFPRIAPPYRRGIKEVVTDPADADSGSGLSAHVVMVGAGEAAPALADNVETLANVAHIVARGADWFRTEGTPESPGTIVCTVTGQVEHAGVGEVIMGTPLREVLDEIGGGPRPGQRYRAVLAGVSNAVIDASQLDTPVSYESLAAIGSGLGAAGFIVFDDSDDMVAVAAGVSHFLAIESCGQCTPCKRDGLQLASLLEQVAASQASARDLDKIRSLLDTVVEGARCALATEQQVVVSSLLDRYSDQVTAHVEGHAPLVEPTLIAELNEIVDGRSIQDERHRSKQPDWSFDAEWSGKLPAELFGEHRTEHLLPE